MSAPSMLVSRCRSRPEGADSISHNHLGTSVILALQRRWRRVKDWYTDSYPTSDRGQDEPSWVSARRTNLANCMFYQLPDELILQILGDLDYVSKALALRTCGLFMRIMFDRTLFSQTFGSRNCRDIRVWPPFADRGPSMPHKAGSEVLALRKQVNPILDRDRFCDSCRQFREEGRYEKAMQVLQGTLWCSHCDRAYKRPLFSAHQRNASSATRICVFAEGKAPLCAHRSIGWDSTQNVTSHREELCRHPDHDPAWYTRWTKPGSTPRPTYERPHLRLRPTNRINSAGINSHTAFLVLRLRRGAPLTRARLQERLIAQADVLDKMLCPHVTTRDGQLLLPFGPDHCACFDCPRWIAHSCTWPHDLVCCRCDTAKKQRPAGYFLPRFFYRLHEYRCVICLATYQWQRYGSDVYLEIYTLRASVGLNLPVRPRSWVWMRKYFWLYHLDPESWGIGGDEELRHVAWCDDINCMTRWRWESLYRLFEDA